MAVRLDNNPWVSSDGLTHTDLNNTLSVFTQTITLVCKNHIRTLFDRAGVYSADETDVWGEAYTDSNGRNDSVDNTNTLALFDTDKYKYNKDVEETYTPLDAGSSGQNSISIAVLKALTITQIRQQIRTGFTGTVLIKKNGSTIQTITSATYSGTSYYTWDITDISCVAGDVIEMDISHTSGDFYLVQNVNANPFFTTESGSPQTFSAGYSGDKDGFIKFKITGDQVISHTIPSGTFSSAISSSIGTFIAEDWEDGADVQFKLTNTGGDDSGWLDTNTYETFTAFTAEPDTLIVKLIPKTTSPTSGYPSIKGFALRCN